MAADPQFEIGAPSPLSVICFRQPGPDEANRLLLDALVATTQ